MSADDFHRKTDLYLRLREDLGGKNSVAWERFIQTDQYKRYKAAARVYLSSTGPASPDMEVKKSAFPVKKVSGAPMAVSSRDDRVLITPEGSVYNSRTHAYDLERGVQLRPEFKGMIRSQRITSVRGNPDTTGKVYYPGNHELGLAGRWVTSAQLAQLEDREQGLLQRRNARLRLMAASTVLMNQGTSPSTSSVYSANGNNQELSSLIQGATVYIVQSDGASGSGVITTIKGRKYVLTANHVIRGSEWARLTSLKDNSSGYANRTGGWHVDHDIAAIVLPASMRHLPAVPLYRGQLPVGQPVYLSGFPGGGYDLTAGIVTGYSTTGETMLHSADGPPGSSGGMLITPNGYLCGIHTAFFLPGSVLYPNKLATPSSVILRLVATSRR
jgi:hypothetical protein